MAILNHGSTIRTADGGQSTTTIVTASNIGTYGVAANSTYFIGTTQNVFNRASGAQTLTGVSIDGNAATVTNGVYTTGAQTIGGTKTFSDGVIVNGATYYTFNKPTTTNYQTVALFGSASAGLFLTTDSAIIGVGAYYNAGWIATATSGRQIDFAGGNFTFGAFSGATVGGAANWGTVAQLSSAGVFSATGDFRAPIFYDSNNTSYYLDAASTSSFNALNLASTLAINGGDGIRVFKSPASSITSQIYWANGANTIAYNWQIDENNNAAMWGYGGTAWAKLLTVTSGGGVGIGTSIISQKLNISGNIMVAPVSSSWAEGLSFTMPTASTWGGLRWRREVANADGNHYIGYTGLDSTDDLVFGSNNGGTQINNNIRITKAGLVGIGTAPSQKFHVAGIGYSDTDFRAPIFYDSANTAYYLDPANTGTSLLVAGKVGIGTTSPAYKLDVGASGSDAISVRLTPGFERVRYYGFDLLGYNDGNLWMIGNNATNTLVLGGSWDWDRQIAIAYTPATTGAAGGSLEIGQMTKNNANFTHGNTRFYTNGIERVRINSSGNVGIGTTSPTQLLDVRGNIKLGGDNSGNYVYYVTDIERTIVRTTRSDVTQEGLLRSDGWGNFTFSNNIGVGLSLGTGYGVGSVGSGIVYANGSVRAPIFYDSANTAYYLDPANTGTSLLVAGNVGIGNTSPSAKLHVLGASYTTASAANNNVRFEGGGGNGLGFGTIDATSTYASWIQSGYVPNFATATYALLLNPLGGNVGIGTTSPTVKLDIASTQANGIVMRYDTSTAYYAWIRPYWNSGTDTRIDFAINRTANVTPDVIMSVGYGSNVGIGTTSPSQKLHVVGTGFASTDFRAPFFYDSDNTTYYLDPNASTSGNLFGVLKQNDGKFVRDSYFRTISGTGDYYASGASGWYTVASITLTTNCTGGVLYGTLYDNRYDGADTYQIAIVARAECDFQTNNESHYVNVGCTILGSTNITNYQSKIRVLLVASSANSRTYEVQFFETSWNRDTWQLETGGSPVWTIYSTAQAPGTSTGTARVFYISNKNADNIRANTASYSPIYYDSNDTSYYSDPAGLNRFNALNIGNQGALTGNTTYALGAYHNSRYMVGLRYSSGGAAYPWLVHDSWNGSAFIIHFNGVGDKFNFSESGIGQASGDFRAPIFYDSNDTNYYVDPASTSLLNNTRHLNIVAGSNAGMTSGGQLAVYSSANPYISFHDGGVGRTAYFQETGGRFYFGEVTYTESEGSFRAPIFYDSGDTTYYLDPANTGTALAIAGNAGVGTASPTLSSGKGIHINSSSGHANLKLQSSGRTWELLSTTGAYFSVYDTTGGADRLAVTSAGNVGVATTSADTNLQVVGHVHVGNQTAFDNTGGWNKTIYLDGTVHARMRIIGSAFASGKNSQTETNIWVDNSVAPYSGLTTNAGSFTINAGFTTLTNSARSPIFYDSDNTAYYIDGASGSKLKYLQIDGDWGSSPFGSGSESFTIRSTYASFCQRQTNGNLGYWLHHIPTDGSYMLYGGRGATDGSSWDWSLRAFPNQDGSYVEFRTSARAPIFYDSDNTAYYIDPANGGFNLRGGNSNRVTFNSGDSGIIVTNAEGISSNVRLGCAWGRPGIYNGSSITIGAETTIDFVIANAVKAYIDSSSNLFSNGSVRSPIFYDSNNTAYYLDAANSGNSLLVAGNVGIGTTSPTYKIQVIGDAYITDALKNGLVETRSFSTSFTNGVANRAADIRFPNSYINGLIEIEVTSGYNNQNSVGVVKKIFSVGANPNNNIWNTTVARVVESHGAAPNNWTIGDFAWDATNSKYIIPIYHIVSTGNTLNINIRYFSEGAVSSPILPTTTLSAEYTATIPAVYQTRHYVYYNDNIGIGTTSPVAMVHVESSNSQGDNKGLIYLKSTSGTNVLKIGVDGTNNFSELRAYTPGAGDNSKLILQPYGGNVGIGTTSPSWLLTVYASTTPQFTLQNGTRSFVLTNNSLDNLLSFNYGSVNRLQFDTTNQWFNTGNLGIGTTDFSYTINDNSRVVGSNTNNRLFVSGSIQLLGNNDAIVFGRGTSTFLTDEELGFGWGGGWYMTDVTYLRVRNDKVLYSAGEIWGSIFKDSNDTAYYLDPANTTLSLKTRSSVMINNASAPNNLAMLNIGYNGAGETRAIDIQGGWSAGESKSITFNYSTGSANIVAQINAQHNGPGSKLRWGKLHHAGDSSTYTMELISESTTSAYLTVAGSVRAPIFYDQNNTAYYVDPASTSVLNNIRTATISAANHGLTCVYYGGGATPTNGYLITTNIDYSTFNMPTVIIEGYAYGSAAPIHLEIVWYAYNNSWTNLSYTNLGAWDPGTISIGTNASGKVCLHLSGLIYYGRFNVRCIYDQGNVPLEGWTVTDATTSALTRVTTISKSAIVTSITGNSATTTLATKATRANGDFFIDDNYGNTVVGLYSPNRLQGVFAMGDSYKLTADGTGVGTLYGLAWSHPNFGGVAANLADHGLLILQNGVFKGAWGGGSLRTPGDVRGTLFYDWDNTAYYCDPASTSNLNAITAAGNITAAQYYTGGWFRNNGSGNGLYNESTGQHFYSDSANYWNVASSAGAQGIRLRTGGHNGTVRGYFYADTNNDVGFLNQDGSWRLRVVGGDYALADGSSMRAQIFYDSNDTNYYVNPASASVLNSLTVTDANLELYKSQTVDMSNTTTYSTSNYYPVTIPVPTEGCIIQIQNNLNSNVPSWATHGSGFTLNLKWRTNGFGWGTTQVRRIIDQYYELFTNQTICGGITQMGNSSTEVVWLRGGGQYYFKFSRNLSATAQSATYTVSSQSVSPTSTAQNTIWSSAGGSSIQYNDQTISTTNMYTPVLYDWNNSAYFVDPASTSNLVGLTVANTITGSITGNAGGSSASCTGNAATATRTSGQSGYPHAGTGMFAFYNWGGSDGGTSAPSASTYTTGLSVGSNPGDQAYGFQIANNMWNTGLWTRNYNSSFGAWIRLLDSSNYVGYSAFTSSLTSTVDVRAPIFYDSNDTTYYTDPSSFSLISSLGIGGLTSSNNVQMYDSYVDASSSYLQSPPLIIRKDSSATGAIDQAPVGLFIYNLNGTNNTWTKLSMGSREAAGAGNTVSIAGLAAQKTAGTANAWATGNLHFWTKAGGTQITNMVAYSAGYVQSDYSFRSPIFYDSNDTTYYIDAASTSSLNSLISTEVYARNWFRNNDSGEGIYNQATTQHFYSDDVSYWNVASSSGVQGIRFRTGGHGGTVRGYVYANDSNDVGFLNSGGNWRARIVGGDYALFDGSSIRAQIFYDSNDTAYYCDPAGTSYLDYSIFNGLSSADYTRQFAPGGGYFYEGGAVTGAIKIRLPANSKTLFPMLSFTCHIYNYSTGTSRTFKIGGHFSSSSWFNPFAYCLSESGGNLNVRWGFEGNFLCVWIGETNTGWSYPNVFITDFQNGYSSINNSWMKGWVVSRVTSFDTVTNGPTAAGFFWNQNNDGSGSGLDADLVDGLEVHTGRNDNANKIVRTDSNGYIQAGWINTTSGDNGTTTIDRVYASSDGYIRYYTPANFRTVLDVPTRGGSGASGSWGISITGSSASCTGNSATATTASSCSGNSATATTATNAGCVTSDTGNVGDSRLQYWQTSGNATLNPDTEWYNAIRMGHGDPVTYYSNTLAVKMTGSNLGDIYTRTTTNGTAGTWNRFWNNNNDGAGSGLDADLLDGINSASFLRSDVSATNSVDLRSPVFYDSSDTAYFLDLNSSGSLIRGRVNITGGHSNSSLRVSLAASENGASTGIATLQQWCSEPGNTWEGAGFGYNVDNNLNEAGNVPAYFFGRPNTNFGQAYMRMLSDGNWYFYNTPNGSNTRYTTMVLERTGYVLASNSIRSPIFYDSDNTAYYCDPSSTSNLVGLTVANTITGNITGNAGGSSASCSGNAATATILQTERTIGGVSFNGSANINLPGVNTAGNQNTTGTAANVTGTVAIANGGTGATTAAAARSNLGIPAAETSSNQSLSGSTTCTIDVAAANVHILALASGTTISSFTYNNRSASPLVNTILVVLKFAGTATVTWSNVVWSNGTTPTLTGVNGKADVYSLTSYKGGTTGPAWIGSVVGQNMDSTNL